MRNRSGVFVLQHSDSDGGFPRERRSLQPAASCSSSLAKSEADPTTEEEEEEEEGSRKDALEQLICSEDKEEAGRLSHRTAAEDSEPDEIVLEDEQVDDFASSVLAAISCWPYRVAMVTEAEGVSVSSNGCNRENARLPEEDKLGGTEPTCGPASTDEPLQEQMEPLESEPTQNPEPETSSDPESLPVTPRGSSLSPQKSEELIPERDPESTEKPSSATPDSDSKTLSSEESSEDEDEDVKEAAETEGEASSILPSSVLDKASAIAQHFTSSVKRSSLAQDDACSLGCASPRLPSRTGSSLSPGAEPADRTLRLNSICSDPAETFGVTDLTLLSPREDSLFDTNRSIRRRRDSTLSKQDQLLIGKIKSYYENAENQDATFSLQRRESLTYIPSGLVRSSVSRFNSVPKNVFVQPSTSTSTTAESNSALCTMLYDTQSHMVSSDSLDSLKSDPRSTDPEDSGESQRSRSQSMQDNPSEDEEFRPSSEMIKIWQTMERQITRSQSEDKDRERYQETSRNSKETDVGLSDMTTTSNKSCEVSGVHQIGRIKDSSKVFEEETIILRAPVPRVTQLKAEAEGERPREDLNQLDEVDRTKSKVLHLARQYSQRIKTTKPVVRQRSQGILISKKSLPCVVEEKESAGKPNLTLPLISHNQAVSLPLSPVHQMRSPTSSSSRVVSPGWAHCCSPLSPLSPPQSSFIESFNWPDVQQLRSKYCDRGQSQKSPVCRTRSIPEQVFGSALRRHSSCSPNLLLPDGASGEVPSYEPHSSRDASREERRKRLHRANSLDPRLSGTQMAELQNLQEQVANGNYNGYYVTAEAPLINNPERKMIIVEKLPLPESEPVETATESKDGEDNYIQIRSPTSREKISIMAVIDRCRLYQESDEYKQREEVKAKTEPERPQELDTPAVDVDDESQKTSSNLGQKTEGGHQSIVKNLREKFQSLS